MKLKKCINCKKEFKQVYSTTQKACTPKCAYEIQKNKRLKDQKKEIKERLYNLKTDQQKKAIEKKKLEQQINTIVKILDKGHPCISCNKHTDREEAGHYHSVGSNESLRFNLLNIWKQCHKCNHYDSANIIGYDEGLLKIYGKEEWERIKFDIKRKYNYIGLTLIDIIELTKVASKIKRELLKAEKKFSNKERLSMRDELNEKIGIYKNK